jgi:hypothetical protein
MITSEATGKALPVAFIFALRAEGFDPPRQRRFRRDGGHVLAPFRVCITRSSSSAGNFALQNAGWASLTWTAGVWPQFRFATGLFIFLSGTKALLLEEIRRTSSAGAFALGGRDVESAF